MAEGELLVFLDPDALIVDLNRDLRDALPAGVDLGMVRGLDGSFNCGVIFVRNSQPIRSFLQICVESG